MNASQGFWWAVEVLVPALGVLVGVTLLVIAAASQVTHFVPREDQLRIFGAGVACWLGGLVWGAFFNDGIPVRRWLTR